MGMPRQARLDAAGALHHVMGRGIEGISIFRSNGDREDFLTRLGSLCEGGALSVHAWALLDNHFHLLIRTGETEDIGGHAEAADGICGEI